ncbi:MAG TPA: adenine phosphoribosyltransferase [Firmicutes bacterium]|nr:adenine phosphoribosyltransferase [Bacillota bacterium]
MDLTKYITSVSDFPQQGILFRDITPLLGNGKAFQAVVEQMAAFAKKRGAEVIVGPESRGFIFGCPVASALGIGFIPVRKKGKLPRETFEVNYGLEYGENTLCIHKDGVAPGQKVVIIDDLLATGGTIDASVQLIEQLGGEVAGAAFLIELKALKGREKLDDIDVLALIQYE